MLWASIMLKRGPVNSRFLGVRGVEQNPGSQDTVAQWPAPFVDPALLFPISRSRSFPRFCISASLPRPGRGCPALYPLWAWYLQGPSPEQLQNPQVLCLFPILCYQWSSAYLSPFSLPNTEKVYPALPSTTELEEAQDGPEHSASDPPQTDLFSFPGKEKGLTWGMQRLDSFLSDESIATGNKAD